jgi:hypothetical protein
VRAKERTAKADDALLKAQGALEEASDDRARIKALLASTEGELELARSR